MSVINVEPIRRGQIYHIDNRFAYDAKGGEGGRPHPYIIMSDNEIIAKHRKVIALQITSMVGKELDFAVPIVLSNHYVSYIKIQEYEIEYSVIKKSQYEGTIIGNDLLSGDDFMGMISDLMILNRFGISACKMPDIEELYDWYVNEFWKKNKSPELRQVKKKYKYNNDRRVSLESSDVKKSEDRGDVEHQHDDEDYRKYCDRADVGTPVLKEPLVIKDESVYIGKWAKKYARVSDMDNDDLAWFVETYNSKGPTELASLVDKQCRSICNAYKNVVQELKNRGATNMK